MKETVVPGIEIETKNHEMTDIRKAISSALISKITTEEEKQRALDVLNNNIQELIDFKPNSIKAKDSKLPSTKKQSQMSTLTFMYDSTMNMGANLLGFGAELLDAGHDLSGLMYGADLAQDNDRTPKP